jgi:hypothetical protein
MKLFEGAHTAALVRTLAATLVAGIPTSCAHVASVPEGQRTQEGFVWSAPMPEGALLRVHTISGRIEVEAASGDRVEVRAQEEGHDGRAPGYRYEVVRDGQDITICALPAEGGECRSTGVHNPGGIRRSVRGAAHLKVLLPHGIKVKAVSSNGHIVVQDVSAEVDAITGNGSVTISRTGAGVRARTGNGHVRVADASGPVEASSGNGNIAVATAEGPIKVVAGNGRIEVTMHTLREAGDLDLHTGNGHVVVQLPEGFTGAVDASGYTHFRSDFPITMQGRQRWGRLRGTIGEAGRRIAISTGTGRVELRKLD